MSIFFYCYLTLWCLFCFISTSTSSQLNTEDDGGSSSGTSCGCSRDTNREVGSSIPANPPASPPTTRHALWEEDSTGDRKDATSSLRDTSNPMVHVEGGVLIIGLERPLIIDVSGDINGSGSGSGSGSGGSSSRSSGGNVYRACIVGWGEPEKESQIG